MKNTSQHGIGYLKKIASPCIAIVGALLISGCMSTGKNVAEYSPEGMKLIKSSQTTRIYRAEDADFSQYDKVQILNGVVAFKKNWQRDYNRDRAKATGAKVKDEDVIKIKEAAGKLITEAFRAEFGKEGGYTIVEKPELSTLILRPSIINLDLNSPDLSSAPRTTTFTRSAGEATLYLEIYDGVTGQILARVMDAEVIGHNGFYQRTNRATNYKDAKITIGQWARVLREHFDLAHEKRVP